jgi:hypothetical protein
MSSKKQKKISDRSHSAASGGRTYSQNLQSNPQLRGCAFDNTVNQWLVKMAEGLMALGECEAAEDAWRMSEDDFVKGVMNRIKEFMPKFHDIYATDCDRGQSWSRSALDKMILLKQQKRQMEVEDAVRTKLLGICTKANQVKGDSIKKKKRMSELTWV